MHRSFAVSAQMFPNSDLLVFAGAMGKPLLMESVRYSVWQDERPCCLVSSGFSQTCLLRVFIPPAQRTAA